MKIKIDELCTQLVILFATLMLVLSGVIGIDRAKFFMYALVAVGCVKLLFLKFRPVQILSVMVVLGMSFITVWLYGGVWANLLVFVVSLVVAISFFNNGIDERTWKLLKVCAYAVCLFDIGYMLLVGGYSEYGQLMLYFDNPNMTGIALNVPATMLVLMAAENKGKKGNYINLILLAVILYMTYMTQNRGSMFAIVLLIVAAVFAVYLKRPKRLCSSLTWRILKLTPIIVMLIYTVMYLILPKSLEIMGKPLFSGRESAWIVAWESIFDNPFAHHTFEEGALNLFLEGAARYGLLSMIGYFVLLISFDKTRVELSEMSVTKYLAYVAFHTCLFQQSFESTMLTGSYSIYIWSYALLGIASMRITEKKDEQIKGKISL